MARKPREKKRKRKTKRSKTQNTKRRKVTEKVKSPMVSRWCFTVNAKDGNVTELIEWYNSIGEIYEKWSSMIRYICGQLEEGTNPHFQGYIQLKRNQRLSWLKRRVHEHARFEPQEAQDNEDARHYCLKPVPGCTCKHCKEELEKRTSIPDTFTEYGTYASGQGVRIDLEGFVDEIKKGKKMPRVSRLVSFRRRAKRGDTL
jgi:hypothetical protein